ncbi:MAG: hypothetical protein A4S09_07290 [Proteobacteria bacterium SG_bin7]|nr:MAG: hypothetical protein A4S09_07290 [Proteobacteria bacterium SG_bin7]
MKLNKPKLLSLTGIRQAIDSLESAARNFGIHFSGYSQISLNKFNSLPQISQTAIIESISFLASVIDSIDPRIDKTRFELEVINRVVRAAKLKVPSDFLNVIEQGDIVEIYDFKSQTQIYRNLEFLRISSYDLLFAIATPFPELFERDEEIGPMLIKRTEDVALKQDSVNMWNIPDHQLIEKLHVNKRIFAMKMKYISPVYCETTGARVAWVSTLRATLVGSAFDDTNVKPITN